MKIKKVFNKKENKWVYKSRFQLNNREFRPVADTKTELKQIIDEIRSAEHRTRYDLPVPNFSPTVRDLFEKHLRTIKRKQQKVLATRVLETFLSLLPEDIKVVDLKRFHFQKFTDLRLSQNGRFTGTPVLPQTVARELSCIGAALKKANDYFIELENFIPPEIKKPTTKKARRERIVSKTSELNLLINHLRKDKKNTHTNLIADYLEFKYQTGLRRKEIFSLQKSQYDKASQSLINIQRWKTESVTKFYPLTKRAAEIIESRMNAQKKSDYLFSPNGKPIESIYRTLKRECKKIGINYGRYKTGGFVAHDLRHNFASEIIETTDPETARELLGHSSLDQLGTYLHTDKKKLRDSVRRRENLDLTSDIVSLYKDIKRGKIKLKEFIEEVRKIAEN